MRQRIVVQCLTCGHAGVLAESSLPRFGERPDAPIAKFVKRLTCEECGSRTVKAWREQQPAA
jgi:RNase P subunit RPR2